MEGCGKYKHVIRDKYPLRLANMAFLVSRHTKTYYFIALSYITVTAERRPAQGISDLTCLNKSRYDYRIRPGTDRADI
jgi:hypothetical protein